ncbi:unnamed protein product [Clonostachys rosea f. rosea IK726]|uniref:Uncharacterized protein n=3 Tax=Bionectria ochroleuca TaxID=29856 RepID=A0A0B7JNY3_BIOOC|nr:unnamed protein product [Clonostachys rosea f. rosea IK726]
MPSHRSQAQFQRAKWRLLILAPFWAFQLALALTIAGVFSYRLGECFRARGKEEDEKEDLPRQLEIGLFIRWAATSIALSSLGAICTLVEIARYMAEGLTARMMLFTHAIKVVCACALLGLDVAVYVKGATNHYSLVGLGLDAVLLITGISLAVYSIRVYRRATAFEDYPHHVNAKSYGFNDEEDQDPTLHPPAKDILPTIERRVSSATNRLSFSSTRTSDSPVIMEPIKRTPSYYSHERDTQFEEYLARRRSVSLESKTDVERVKAKHMSWNSPLLEPISYEDSIQQPAGGRPRAISTPRAPSWASDHVLVAVPEEDEATRDERDRETLLGSERRSSLGDETRVSQDSGLEPKWQKP